MIHLPKHSEVSLKVLREAFPDKVIVDTSWIHDLSDSATFGDAEFSVYFPNALEKDDGDEDSFDTFAFGYYPRNVFFSSDNQYKSIDEVINIIKQYYASK